MIDDKDNLLSNKANLIRSLVRFSDVFHTPSLDQIFNILVPLAQGKVIEPQHSMSAAEAADPLNPYKMGTGSPQEVQAAALHALACIDKASHGHYGKKVDEIIEAGCGSLDAAIRRASFAAAREIPRLSTPIATALLIGTRDTDTNAAAMAYFAFASKKRLKLTSNEWHLLAYSLEVANQSSDPILRQSAAFTVSKLTPQVREKAVKKRMQNVQRLFEEDICASVRMAAGKPPA